MLVAKVAISATRQWFVCFLCVQGYLFVCVGPRAQSVSQEGLVHPLFGPTAPSLTFATPSLCDFLHVELDYEENDTVHASLGRRLFEILAKKSEKIIF